MDTAQRKKVTYISEVIEKINSEILLSGLQEYNRCYLWKSESINKRSKNNIRRCID